MSRTTQKRRTQTQCFAVVGLGAAAVLAGTASAASAATGVVIPLAPGEVVLSAVPVENLGAMDPMADPNATPALAPVGVQYGGTIIVDLPVELDDSAVEAELDFDDDGDGTPDVTYSSALAPGDPFYLAVTGQGTGSIEVVLPVDDNAGVDNATLYLSPLTSDLGAAFTFVDPLFYELTFDAAAAAEVTVEPELVAFSQVPCAITSGTRCAFPTAVTAGSTVALDLTVDSVLRELGIVDLSGLEVGLQQLDANGEPVGAAVALSAQVTASGATFVIPAGTAAGSYGLVIAQEGPSGVISVVTVELTIVAAEAAPAAAPTAAPTTSVNAGLRSNTGAEIVQSDSTGSVAIATGAGMLLVAGVGGVAVARSRRRAAAEGGTWEA